MSRTQPASGFTLIELVVTVAIVGILAAAAVPLMELTVQRHKEMELARALRQIRTGLDEYKKAWDEGRIEKRVGQSGYPPSLEILVQGVPDARDASANRRRIYFLRRLPRDPFADDASIPAAETWGKRSYASPPDAPAAGDDVFDVYSQAPGRGLNGVPYREW